MNQQIHIQPPRMSLLAGLLLIFALQCVQVEGVCFMCPDFAPPTRYDHVPPGSSTTCFELYTEGFRIADEDSSRCRQIQNDYQDPCCSEIPPGGYPTQAPQYVGETGDQPDCPVCRTMEFPGFPRLGVDGRYVGVYTCQQLYDRGLNGMTPAFVCETMQDFTMEYCGCGKFHPDCIDDPTKCWDYRNPDPTDAPVQPPTGSLVVDSPTSSPILPPFKDPPSKGRASMAALQGYGGTGAAAKAGGIRRRQTVLKQKRNPRGTGRKLSFKPVELNEADEPSMQVQ